jgi:VWFA-related protein
MPTSGLTADPLSAVMLITDGRRLYLTFSAAHLLHGIDDGRALPYRQSSRRACRGFFMPRISALLASTALCLSAAAAAQDNPKLDDPKITFRSDVSLGRVDAQVVDADNRPIRGLRVQDFILRIDGKQQDIRDFQSEKMPVDLMLLLDVSRSMEPHIRRVANASHQALRTLRDLDRVAIMVFDRFTRLRMPFRSDRQNAEQELEYVLSRESFEGGTDITRGLLDTAAYMAQNGRRDGRRAIVIVTDDQTERSRNEPAVLSALTRADSVLSALIAPDALRTGNGGWRRFDDDRPRDLWGYRLPPGYRSMPHTQSAGTSLIATQSGGDSMPVDQGSAFEQTLARIRERYALYFYLPDGASSGEARSVEVELSDAARRRYPRADVRYRRSYLSPNTVTEIEHR